MLQITPQQMLAFDVRAAAMLDERMVQVIGAALPDLLHDEAPGARRKKLADWVDKGCERALDLGLDAEVDIAVMVTLQLAHILMSASDQERLRDWAGPLMQRESSNGQVKMALIESMLSRLADTQPLARRLRDILARVRAAYA